jgi:hypothetical protein
MKRISHSVNTSKEDVEMELSTLGWTSHIEIITPTIARALLATNNGNRKLRPMLVSRYASMMRDDNWLLTPEPIVVAKTGRLLNGQHRLSAIIEADMWLNMFVVRGVSEEAFPAMDRGAGRTFSDANSINKYLSETAKLLVAILENTTASAIDSKVLEQVRFLEEPHNALMAACPSMAKVFSTTSFRLAACIWMLDPNPNVRNYVTEVYSNLIQGKVADLPPVAQTLMGLVATNKLEKNHHGHLDVRTHLTLKAYSVFNPDNCHMTRMPLITEKSLDRFLSAVDKARAKSNLI